MNIVVRDENRNRTIKIHNVCFAFNNRENISFMIDDGKEFYILPDYYSLYYTENGD